jgi:hypothetical protein
VSLHLLYVFQAIADNAVLIYGDIKKALNATGGVEIAAIPK